MSAGFEFTPDYQWQVDKILARYPADRKMSAVLPVLDLAQRQNGGHVTDAIIDAVAAMLDMPRIRVVEVATFYTMINLQPVGKYHLQCCTTTPCWLRGSSDVVDAIRRHLGIDFGERTPDGMFSMVEVECLGACVNAPVVQINDDFFEDLDAKSVVNVLNDLKAGNSPRPGPQIDRHTSAPVGGATSLKDLEFAKE